jgi:hypothetical protein
MIARARDWLNRKRPKILDPSLKIIPLSKFPHVIGVPAIVDMFAPDHGRGDLR